MRTLPASLNTEKDAAQSGWAELVDIYLKESITTPFGTTNVLRLTTLPGGQSFFTPTVPPEPTGTQGDAATYFHWPFKRSALQSSNRNTADKITLTCSNVTTDFAQMLEDVSFYDCWVVVRKISTSITGATSSDCLVLFIGQIDSWTTTPELVSFHVSGDLTALNIVLPRENMHQNCRFNWSDDWCTKLRWHPDHYKSKTVGAASTTTLINSAGLTEDTGSDGSYGTDEINALVDGSITASSEDTGSGAINVTAYPEPDYFISASNHGLAFGDPFTLGGSVAPAGLTLGATYYAKPFGAKVLYLSATAGGATINFTTAGTSVTITRLGYHGYQVKASNPRHWKFTLTDWGVNTNGFYEITTGTRGYANPLMKPYLQFDLGSAKALRLWRLANVETESADDQCRIVQLYSSPDATAWTHESDFEIPVASGVTYEMRVPAANSRRYWRLAIRNKWGHTPTNTGLRIVEAYTGGRHYWRLGRITFDAATATAALQGVSRRITESYSGAIIVAPALPVAPASGDTLKIERGCGGSFADCCERKNTENFGGFLDLANQTIIR